MARGKTLQVRITTDEKVAWTAQADAVGMTLSKWVRMLANRTVHGATDLGAQLNKTAVPQEFWRCTCGYSSRLDQCPACGANLRGTNEHP